MSEYKILYVVAETVSLKTKGSSGLIRLHQNEVEIEGPTSLRFRYDEMSSLKICKQHKVGTIIHLRVGSNSVWLSAPRVSVMN